MEGLLFHIQVGAFSDSTENEHEIISGQYSASDIPTNLNLKNFEIF